MRKYKDACAAMGGSFTPFVVTADGVLAPQADKLVTQELAQRLCERPNSFVNASLLEGDLELARPHAIAVCHCASCQVGAEGTEKELPPPTHLF
jgi:hypothetical protein